MHGGAEEGEVRSPGGSSAGGTRRPGYGSTAVGCGAAPPCRRGRAEKEKGVLPPVAFSRVARQPRATRRLRPACMAERRKGKVRSRP